MDGRNPLFNEVFKTKVQPNLEDSLVASKADAVQQLIEKPDFTHYDNYFAIKTFPEFISCKIMDIPYNMAPVR